MRTLAVLALATVLLVAGCGDDGEDVGTSDGPPSGRDDPLAGRTFLSEPGADLVTGTRLRLTFDGGQLGLQAGCNQLSGGYRLDGDTTLVVEPLGGTEMGCDPALMDQDARLAELFAAPVPFVLEGDTLTVEPGGATFVLVDEQSASPDAALVGPGWTLDTLVEGDIASSVPAGVTATIAFDADGAFQIETGCNAGEGTYAAPDEGTIAVEEVAVELAGCDDERGTVEEAVLGVLHSGVLTVSIDGDRLTLTAADGTGLGFTAG
ncbi:META domain-containing protein [Iamia sp. SCSIO 61187]|uniref:META domain-containing protein n=1 Tax=Iamia sp. SCSIO 61187 TaxID=2722752 RepID=UPI001C62D5EF|nr:META domain-containing protein [Iamia sp. SCSIO 61187]QYG94529.1 META domain-containing protein [Iamia sp. SCSIO 61187]